MVAIPGVASHAPDEAFDVEHFKYDKNSDTYTCPANETLTTNGHWYNKSHGKTINKMKQYITKSCKTCELRAQCTKNQGGRMIERSEHADLIQANKERIEKNPNYYRRRQAIVEHPYGTIKRLPIAIGRGFSYIITKRSMKRATADVGLMLTAYNFRRIMNIIGIEALRSYLLALFAFFGAFLTSLEAFCRTQKDQLLNSFEKLSCVIFDLMAALVVINFKNINFKGSY